MCGRFTLIRLSDFTDLFPWIRGPEQAVPPRYNIAPAQPVAIVTHEEGQARVQFAHWGLIPHWAKDPSIGGRLVNARGETVEEKPAFRTAFRRRRCLVPASGFYEWKRAGKGKTPMYIRLRGGAPLAFAGLWDLWHDPAGTGSEIPSCTIITTTPNELMADIHDRMPAILRPADYQRWLSPLETGPADLIAPYPAGEMEAYPVSTLVNVPKNDSQQCIVPAAAMETPAPKTPSSRKRGDDQPTLF